MPHWKQVLLALVLLASSHAVAAPTTFPSRPNIVFILIDDMGLHDLTCYGSTFYETPRIDALAARGMRFTQAYASAPVCSPTRASILCGKYPARVGVTDWIGGRARGKLIDAPYTDHLPLEETTIAEALKTGGYQTWHVGKWHLGTKPYWPQMHGFDVNVAGYAAGHPKTFFSPYQIPTLKDGPAGEYLTDRLTDEAITLIEQSDGRPFFLNLWHYAVHIPIESPPALVEKYQRKARDLGLDNKKALEPGEPFPTERKQNQRVIRRRVQSDPAYAAMVENLDTNISRLIDALERRKLLDNTLIIFTSDNGGLSTAEGSPTSNAPQRDGKGWPYEGGVRVPLIVCWPGVVRAGSTCDSPVTSCDFFPTMLDAAKLPPMPQQHVDGLNLMPILNGSGALSRDTLYWHYPHYGNQGGTPASSMRAGYFKLIEWYEDNRLELFNLRDDPSESHDLSDQLPDRARSLHQQLQDWRRQIGAIEPTRNDPHK